MTIWHVTQFGEKFLFKNILSYFWQQSAFIVMLNKKIAKVYSYRALLSFNSSPISAWS